MGNESEAAMVRIAVEALKKERDDLVLGIDRIQLTAVKWARAFGGNTPLAIVADELRKLIGDRATDPSSEEGKRRIGLPDDPPDPATRPHGGRETKEGPR